MRRLLFGLTLAIPVIALATGCAASPTTTKSDSPAGASKAVEPIPVAITEITKFEELDKVVNDRKGNVVLVDFWATWCVPCVKKFPHLVETHKKYAPQGLACISASLDPKPKGDYDKDEVLKFLKEKDATFPNLVLIGYRTYDNDLGRRFGYEGGLPLLVLFDKTGKKVWDSEMKKLSDEELDKLIEAELAK